MHPHGLLLTRRKCEFHRDIFADGRFSCDFKTTKTSRAKLGELCPKCAVAARRGLVWRSGEFQLSTAVGRWLKSRSAANDGVFICVGTSAQVTPASHLIPIFAPAKNKYIIDLRAQPTGDYTLLEGPATAMMKKLADELLGE